MKRKMLKKLALGTIAGIVAVSSFNSAQACSRMAVATEHGVVTTRSFDWSTELNSVANVRPVGYENASKPLDHYENVASWEAKYHSISFIETIMLNGATGMGVNSEGLQADLLYQGSSIDYLEQHQDSGAPAVHIADGASFLLENFATVKDIVAAFENNEWQIGWNQLTNGHKHPFHLSAVDKHGDVVLFQLGEGGEVKVHVGTVKDDMGVKTNEPLLDDQRAYVAALGDLKDPQMGARMLASPSSMDRYARLRWVHANLNFEGLNEQQSMGKALQGFTYAAVNSHDLPDDRDVNEQPYQTWVSFGVNLESGEITTNLHKYGTQMRFNFDETLAFTTPMCADTVEQSLDNAEPVWKECE